MRGAHLMQVIEERVQIVQAANALVQRFHNFVGVIGELLGGGLLLARLQITEVCEEIQEVTVLLEESFLE